MKRKTVIITIVFIALALAIPAGAQIYGRGMPKRSGHWSGKRGPALGKFHEIRSSLTTEQRDEILKIREAFLDDTLELRNDIREKSIEFRNLFQDKNSSKKEVMAARKKLMDLKTVLFEKKFDLRQKQREIINADSSNG